jgi:hypothetical protein
VGLATLPPSVSRLSRQCGILNISQPYRPPWSVTGIVFILDAGWGFNCSIRSTRLSLICHRTSLPHVLIFAQTCLSGLILDALFLTLTGSHNFSVEVNENRWIDLQFHPVLYTNSGFLQENCSLCCMIHAGFLLSSLFSPGDVGHVLPQNANLLLINKMVFIC